MAFPSLFFGLGLLPSSALSLFLGTRTDIFGDFCSDTYDVQVVENARVPGPQTEYLRQVLPPIFASLLVLDLSELTAVSTHPISSYYTPSQVIDAKRTKHVAWVVRVVGPGIAKRKCCFHLGTHRLLTLGPANVKFADPANWKQIRWPNKPKKANFEDSDVLHWVIIQIPGILMFSLIHDHAYLNRRGQEGSNIKELGNSKSYLSQFHLKPSTPILNVRFNFSLISHNVTPDLALQILRSK
ncbi:hypothetical protein B0H16DRAFT_1483175 [Mycena metata]|uniref:Uncharacterized protein n=1 Tax=Mycena metata TaxID=1033252 RepID=A0AAD7GN88_9AGAR|nr:hypothetical protein B0H16DRAFT_1483175 [Mycena metata]